jgi:hypothetical protein
MTRYTPLWLQAGSYAASVDRRLMGSIWPNAASTGCLVTLASGMTVNIAQGTVAVPTQNATGSTLCVSDAIEQVTLAGAPGSGSNRYDLVICQPRGNDLDAGSNNDFIFTTVTGVALASPVVPPVPAGAVALAQIYIPGGSAAITAGNIVDRRPGNLAISDAIGAAVPTCYRRRNLTSALSTPSGSTTNVNFQTEDPYSTDVGGLLTWDAVNFQFVTNRAGIWHMQCVIGGGWGGAGGRRRIGLMWGANFLAQQSGMWTTVLYAGLSCSAQMYLPVSTPISVQLFQDSGAAQTIGPHSGAAPCYLAMSLVR